MFLHPSCPEVRLDMYPNQSTNDGNTAPLTASKAGNAIQKPECEDLDVVSGCSTAAQAARQVGHDEIANKKFDVAASKKKIKDLLTSGGNHDSLGDRIGALFTAVSAKPPAATCAVCQTAPVEAALQPCFHAAFCVECARVRRSKACPLCGGRVSGFQRIFFG
jgi:hypothetical protein